MRTIKWPAVFLAQFAVDAAPFNSLKSNTAWAAVPAVRRPWGNEIENERFRE
jgi:hypothetical protein